MKIGRSNSREYDPEYRNRRLFQKRGHSRNSSHDFDFENRHKRQPNHSRTSSRDEPLNIKYILNCLKPDASTNRFLMSSAAMMAQVAVVEHGAVHAAKKHCRNHSYDQIYSMQNQIKLDHELHNKLNRHRTLKAATSTPAMENDSNTAKPSNSNVINKESHDNRVLNRATDMPIPANYSGGSHSRTNSKDLNKSSFLSSLVDDATNILRHRRTNSKDLNRILNPMPSTSETGALTSGDSQVQPIPTQSQYHKRNISLPRNDLPEEQSADVAQVLLLGNNENSDMQKSRRDNE